MGKVLAPSTHRVHRRLALHSPIVRALHFVLDGTRCRVYTLAVHTTQPPLCFLCALRLRRHSRGRVPLRAHVRLLGREVRRRHRARRVLERPPCLAANVRWPRLQPARPHGLLVDQHREVARSGLLLRALPSWLVKVFWSDCLCPRRFSVLFYVIVFSRLIINT